MVTLVQLLEQVYFKYIYSFITHSREETHKTKKEEKKNSDFRCWKENRFLFKQKNWKFEKKKAYEHESNFIENDSTLPRPIFILFIHSLVAVICCCFFFQVFSDAERYFLYLREILTEREKTPNIKKPH